MAKYLLLKHYRGGPAPAVDWAPMEQWTPDEVDAHMRFMQEFGARLEETGELVDAQALSPDGALGAQEPGLVFVVALPGFGKSGRGLGGRGR